MITGDFFAACFLLGQWYYSEKEDGKRSFEEHLENCLKNNFAKSCYQAGFDYYNGRGVNKNMSKAFDMYSRGCFDGKVLYPLDVGLPCLMAGQALTGLDDEMVKEVKPDGKKGLEALNKGCSAGLPEACETLLSLYLYGSSEVPKNHEEAPRIAEKCCQKNRIPCCYTLYHIYKKGIGTPIDLKKANEAKKKADALLGQAEMSIKFGEYT